MAKKSFRSHCSNPRPARWDTLCATPCESPATQPAVFVVGEPRLIPKVVVLRSNRVHSLLAYRLSNACGI